MIPHPVAIGLTICDAVIVEQGTHKVSAIGAFTRLELSELPGYAPPFSVLAILTEGSGQGSLELVVARLDTGDEIYSRRHVIQFSGVLAEMVCHLRVRECYFPVPGLYQFTLLVDGDWVAHRRLRVQQ